MGTESDEVKRLETLIEINALINSEYRDVRVLLSRIMESAERLIGTEASSLLLVDAGTGQLHFEIALGDKGEDVKKYTLNRGEGIAGWVAQNDRSLVVNDAQNDPRHYTTIGTDTGYKTRNLLAVPMRAKDDVIGVLEVINKIDDARFDDEDLRFLEVLADQASIALQNAREFGEIRKELASLRERLSSDVPSSHRGIIWKSSKMEQLLDQAGRISKTESPVLILGESGTGKELLAERIHHTSSRSDNTFLRINCAAIPEELLESELFGHVKGSFTDAIKDKVGLFERGDSGTLFLDEIGELPPTAQGKLLRVLQDGRFQRVGGDADIIVNVRVIAATNKDLAKAVDNGQFRNDLYYRLAVFTLEIPPLRERPDDVEILARHFLSHFGKLRRDAPKDFSMESLEYLLSHQWPGNVRELQNAVERSVVIARGDVIYPSDLSQNGTEKGDKVYVGKNLKEAVTLFKKNYIREVLDANGGNQTITAEKLGIQRTYLSRMIKELEIERRGERK